jgi:hypothetical protein
MSTISTSNSCRERTDVFSWADPPKTAEQMSAELRSKILGTEFAGSKVKSFSCSGLHGLISSKISKEGNLLAWTSVSTEFIWSMQCSSVDEIKNKSGFCCAVNKPTARNKKGFKLYKKLGLYYQNVNSNRSMSCIIRAVKSKKYKLEMDIVWPKRADGRTMKIVYNGNIFTTVIITPKQAE